MVLVLRNEEMEGLITMDETIAAMEGAFIEHGRKIAVNRPRQRIYLPREDKDTYYMFNVLPGSVPACGTTGLRIDSFNIRFVEKDGKTRHECPGDFAGLVFLFDIATCQLKAILHDHFLSIMRVGATTGVATKYMAREDARVVGIFGSGEQAKTALMAVCAVRPIERVKVFSTSPEKRAEFSMRMAQALKTEVVPVESPREVVRGSDIVITATNAHEPVFNGDWIEEGTHVVTMLGSDYFIRSKEIDERTVMRSGLIVVNLKEQILQDRQPELYHPLQRGELKWEDIFELGELVTRQVSGRTNTREITLFNNNVGMGIQFAAIGALVLEKARQREVGTELPDDLFTTVKGDAVYAP